MEQTKGLRDRFQLRRKFLKTLLAQVEVVLSQSFREIIGLKMAQYSEKIQSCFYGMTVNGLTQGKVELSLRSSSVLV
jgi:hypothetical protein